MKFKILAAATIITMIAAMSIGCGKKEISEEVSEAESVIQVIEAPESAAEMVESLASISAEEVDPDAGFKILGEKSDKGTVYRISLKNLTGKKISTFSVLDQNEKIDSGNLLAESESIDIDETVILYYDSEEVKNSAEETVEPSYKLKVTFEDGETAILSNIPFHDFTEGSICSEDGVTFFAYQSISQVQEISTKENELALKENTRKQQAENTTETNQSEQRQYEEPQNQRGDERVEAIHEEPAEEPSYEEPSYEEPAEEPSYEEPSYEKPAEEPSYEEPSYEEPSYDDGGGEAAGPEDDCIGNDGLTW